MEHKKLVIKNEYERVVVGEVYIPNQEDAHGNIMTAEEIKKSCYDFMKNQRTFNIDLMHNEHATGSYLVENFIARTNDPDGFVEGAWVAATKIESDEIWEKVIKGEINCYSLAGSTFLDSHIDEVPRIVESSGETHKNLDELIPPHTHSITVKFDANNKIVPTLTGITMGHAHGVSSSSVTEESFGHTHRYSFN